MQILACVVLHNLFLKSTWSSRHIPSGSSKELQTTTTTTATLNQIFGLTLFPRFSRCICIFLSFRRPVDRRSRLISGPSDFSHVSHVGPADRGQIQQLMGSNSTPGRPPVPARTPLSPLRMSASATSAVELGQSRSVPFMADVSII